MIGIDEVGRGAWAGPLLVVAARATADLPQGLTDSKLLTSHRRNALMPQLSATCQFGAGWVMPEEIDTIGLAAAMRLAVNRALDKIRSDYSETIIMDGSVNYCPDEYANVQCIIKADIHHPIVSAASVYAKVTRDSYMRDLEHHSPGYGYDKHVGYGTGIHKTALLKLGVSRHHRKSFKPIQDLL